ncbi:MAG TPA: PLP-dependent transferase, partial [Polyangiaceae bacterium]|nr:PLP-dependent transferase [Polyangiaceae bacterium]
ATFLERHPAVRVVNYPGLESHRGHARARAWFAGAGGLLSFELHGGVSAAERLFARLTLPVNAPSLGGPETLITRPVMTSHRNVPVLQRQALGITDALVRMSIGIEATEDLIDDLDRSLGQVH